MPDTGHIAELLDFIIDHDDEPVHVRIPGLMVAYCGVRLDTDDSIHFPLAEITEASWCPDCVRIQDGT